MRALHIPAAGEQPQLSELPTPEVTDGHVLVKVRAAGLNAIDNVIASGSMAQRMPYEYPVAIGRDAAGVVTAVGAGVDDLHVGQEVFGHVLLDPPIHDGTLAEFALLPATTIVAMPPGLDPVVAAALPLAGAAAVACVHAIDPEPGQTVLVLGASGGVGSFVVQLLAGRGVIVVGTSTAADADRVTGLGATAVIDYTAGPVADQVAARYPDDVDALIDLVSRTPDDLPLSVVRRGGKVASTLGVADEQKLATAGLTGTNIMAHPVREITAPLAEQAVAGKLKVDVTTVLPLEQAADGLTTFGDVTGRGKTRGKIVVKVGD